MKTSFNAINTAIFLVEKVLSRPMLVTTVMNRMFVLAIIRLAKGNICTPLKSYVMMYCTCGVYVHSTCVGSSESGKSHQQAESSDV